MHPSHDISTISKRHPLQQNSRILEIRIVFPTFRDLKKNEDLYSKPREGVMKAAAALTRRRAALILIDSSFLQILVGQYKLETRIM